MLTFEEFDKQTQAFFSLIDAEEEIRFYRVTNDPEAIYGAQQGCTSIEYLGLNDWRFHGNGAIGRGNTLLGAFANYIILFHEWIEKAQQEQLAREL